MPSRPGHLLRALASFSLGLITLSAARGHDPGLSSVVLRLDDRGAVAIATFNPRDVDPLIEREGVTALAKSLIELSVDGRPVSAGEPQFFRESANVKFEFRFPFSNGSRADLRMARFDSLPFGHRQLARIESADNRVIAEAMLSEKSSSLGFTLAPHPASAQSAGFVPFFLMGVRHIATGYDHLLFLFGLLIVCADFWPALKIITCFTVAHSITLALATFNIVTLPGAIVEPLIAATIVYVGIENLVRRNNFEWRWMLTFLFGLVHGLGFASALREMGVGESGRAVAVPLISFNLGVEAGQLAVAAILLPIIWKLRKNRAFVTRLMPACSLVVVALGAYWLIQRTLLPRLL